MTDTQGVSARVPDVDHRAYALAFVPELTARLVAIREGIATGELLPGGWPTNKADVPEAKAIWKDALGQAVDHVHSFVIFLVVMEAKGWGNPLKWAENDLRTWRDRAGLNKIGGCCPFGCYHRQDNGLGQENVIPACGTGVLESGNPFLEDLCAFKLSPLPF